MIIANNQTLTQRVRDRARTRREAEDLQKKGMTLSEIAVELDCDRDTILDMLYWGKVR
jgi:orotate phosphoribosyltransferase-like protein